jgi:hypothetical protein
MVLYFFFVLSFTFLLFKGYFFYRKDHGGNPPGTIALVAVIAYISFFSSGLGAIPWCGRELSMSVNC